MQINNKYPPATVNNARVRVKEWAMNALRNPSEKRFQELEDSVGPADWSDADYGDGPKEITK